MINRRALLAIACSVLLIAAPWCLGAEPATVRISSVEVVLSPVGPVVLLKAKGRAVPIFVDPVVAESIDAELGGKKPPRPLTHDLMQTILQSLDAKITKASITLKGATYIADLRVTVNGKERVFDSRSSDAIALALRFGAPIFVGEDLLKSAGKPLPEAEGQEL
jgi:hypothetical protein